ncbi:MAG: hypothetical protein ACI8P0_005685 [Planctomycetaceae bacterium]|jgi:hypothetical protein
MVRRVGATCLVLLTPPFGIVHALSELSSKRDDVTRSTELHGSHRSFPLNRPFRGSIASRVTVSRYILSIRHRQTRPREHIDPPFHFVSLNPFSPASLASCHFVLRIRLCLSDVHSWLRCFRCLFLVARVMPGPKCSIGLTDVLTKVRLSIREPHDRDVPLFEE